MSGREEGSEQAELPAADPAARAAAHLRWLRRLVHDLDQVISAAAADTDADISLLGQGFRMREDEHQPWQQQSAAPQSNGSETCAAGQPVLPVHSWSRLQQVQQVHVCSKYCCKYNCSPEPTPPLGQPYVTATRPPAHWFSLWSTM